jgi:hypothetical protein
MRVFLGVTSPGVEFCARAALVLLDGISFPVIAQELDNDTGDARFVGCAVVRGVDMSSGDADRVVVPPGYALNDRMVFKFH